MDKVTGTVADKLGSVIYLKEELRIPAVHRDFEM
jgi:hypothetical protein